MRAALGVIVCGVCWVAAAACGGSSTTSGFDDGGSSSGGSGSSSGSLTGSGSGGVSSGSFGDGGSGSSSGGGPGCSGQAADFVYVLSAQNDLYRFAPNLKQFTKIGPLQCKTGMQPNSMAVDRDANAYVNYVQSSSITGTDSAGVVFKVSTTDASCSAQPVLTLPKGWYRIGMGYSTDTVGGSSETLYVAGVGSATGNGTGLGLVDFGKGTVGPIGPFTGGLAGKNAELTGTGDGRLFGYFSTNPVQVAQIDKSSGATPSPVPMTGVKTPTDWAFSFWGGHFYLYTSQGFGSTVTDYDPTSGNIDTHYMSNVGFDIVGAGVSTCAPVTPPQ